MIVIVTGSREITNPKAIESAFENCGWLDKMKIFYHGNCRGVDQLAAAFIKQRRPDVFILPFPVSDEEWKRVGKSAGPKRNQRMVDTAIASSKGGPTPGLVAVWDGHSTGTGGTIEYAKQKGIWVHVHRTY